MNVHKVSRRLLWISFCLNMLQLRTFRSVLLHVFLFALGILTTLLVLAHREDTIEVCDPAVGVSSINSKNDIMNTNYYYDRNNNNDKGLDDKIKGSPPNSGRSHFNSYSYNNQPPRGRRISPLNERETLLRSNKTIIINTNNNNTNQTHRNLVNSSNYGSDSSRNGLSEGVVINESPNDDHVFFFTDRTQTEEPNYFDTSVSVSKLQLPFSSKVKRNLVYVVTPTYNRPEQIPELTRLAQALLQVNHLVHWVVVEDVDRQTPNLVHFLNKFNLQYSMLKSVKPKVFEKVVGKPRGVGARRAALEWLRSHQYSGVVYFADDDNTYDSDIFRQMERTKKVSMWPVGLVTELGVSSPIVRQGKVIGFYDGWRAARKFAVDMAGFAINLKLIHARKNANMPWVAGYEEDEILRSLGINLQDIQPLANNCTEILVWHTKSAKNNWSKKASNLKPSLEDSTNLKTLLKKLPKPNSNSAGGKNVNHVADESGFSIMKLLLGSG